MKHDESMKARLRYHTPSDLLIWRTASDCPLSLNSCSTLSVNVLVHKEGSDTAQPLLICVESSSFTMPKPPLCTKQNKIGAKAPLKKILPGMDVT